MVCVWWDTTVTPAFKRLRQEDQEIKVIFGYIECPRPASATLVLLKIKPRGSERWPILKGGLWSHWSLLIQCQAVLPCVCFRSILKKSFLCSSSTYDLTFSGLGPSPIFVFHSHLTFQLFLCFLWNTGIKPPISFLQTCTFQPVENLCTRDIPGSGCWRVEWAPLP